MADANFGNVAIAGTLAVAGLSSLATLAVSGLSSLATLTTSGLATLASLTVTGATNLATLATSGLATLNSLTVTGVSTLNSLAVTTATTLSSTLGVTGLVTANSGIQTTALIAEDGTAGTYSTNALIRTFRSGAASNYLHVQTSLGAGGTGTGTTEGTLFGVDERESIIFQRESGQAIVLQNEQLNGTVALRGNKLNIRSDTATDGTFTSTATIGTFRNDNTANYTQYQSQTSGGSGTATGAGVLVGIDGVNGTINALGGSVILETAGGTVTLDTSGNFQATAIGSIQTAVFSFSCGPAFLSSATGAAAQFNEFGISTSNADMGAPWRGASFTNTASFGTGTNRDEVPVVGYSTLGGITLLGYGATGEIDTSSSANMRLTVNGSTVTGSDISLSKGSSGPLAVSGTLNRNIVTAGYWGYRCVSGTLNTSSWANITVYYRINSF